MKKFLIIGLGNPGAEYENTRHNVFFEPNRYADTASLKIKGRTLILIKPSTYMNLSGKAVNYYLQSEKVELENILILTDDIALPFGQIRMRKKGSDGGHNGLKHIIETLDHSKFNRVRFGVGNEFSKGKQIDYVLGKWSLEEEEALKERLEQLIKMIHNFALQGASKAMTEFNGK
jgi:PTH1 family peptidyl-tRNA hydrolase